MYERLAAARATSWNQVEEEFLSAMKAYRREMSRR